MLRMAHKLTGRIIVDADACPVKSEIAQVAEQFGIEVWFVASISHQLSPMQGVRIVQVDAGSQSADMYIANHTRKGDIVVTQDYGLAALGLAKQAVVLSNRGQRYDSELIDSLLDQRHVAAKRRRNGKYGKGPKAFTEADRNNFLHVLTKVLLAMQENGGT